MNYLTPKSHPAGLLHNALKVPEKPATGLPTLDPSGERSSKVSQDMPSGTEKEILL